ncbi:MAG TPA: molecular chaperone DnaJ [Acidimicrobiales bacterium]|jgi:molecular chaperone DnaJ
MSDFYELLGLSRDADAAEIKKAYRRLARELHPDANPGDREAEERFKAVSRAYETLADPDKRARYDRYGEEGVTGGHDFTGMSVNDIFQMFFGGDPFGGFGGGDPRGAGPPRGADLEVMADLSLEDVVFGTRHDVEVRTADMCGSCDGSGAEPPSQPETCGQCQGAGQVRMVRQTLLGQMVTAGACSQCGGMGQVVRDPCRECRGEGRTIGERRLTIEVPAGVDDGTTLRLTGRGAVGPRGGPTGDLYVHVRVRSHDVFQRDGRHLRADLPVSIVQATLGATLPFETLDGPTEIEVPRGTQTGRVIRLRGQGVPGLDGRGRGDVLVSVVVETPSDLDDTTETLLRDLADHWGHTVDPPPAGVLGRIKSAFRNQ